MLLLNPMRLLASWLTSWLCVTHAQANIPPRTVSSHLLLLLLSLLLHQLSLSPPSHGERRHSAAQRHAGKGGAGQQEAPLAVLPDHGRPPPQEVVEQRLLLGERAEGEQDVEELVAVADDVEAAGREALGHGTREEEGRQQEQQHLQEKSHVMNKDGRTLVDIMGQFYF